MSNLEELDRAVSILKVTGLTLMQCSSIYPCPDRLIGLNQIEKLGKRYHRPVGLSDHSLTITAAVAAVALGAVAIEKHITLTNQMVGPDAPFSFTPERFDTMVKAIRITEEMLKPIDKDDIGRYKDMKNIFQKSIVSTMDIQQGDVMWFI